VASKLVSLLMVLGRRRCLGFKSWESTTDTERECFQCRQRKKVRKNVSSSSSNNNNTKDDHDSDSDGRRGSVRQFVVTVVVVVGGVVRSHAH